LYQGNSKIITWRHFRVRLNAQTESVLSKMSAGKRDFVFFKIFIIFFSEDVWKTVAKPNVVNTAEGEDVTVEVQIAGGNPEKLPEVKFVKGKWNELNGPNYVIDANTEDSFQISRTSGNSPIKLWSKYYY